MKDFKIIVEEYSKLDLAKRKAAIATVVRVRGSSYRSPGARMLIADDGRWVGSISGGCLEGDALRKARQVMTDNKAITVTYDTNEDSNQSLGIGLGCNGIIDVLIEPAADAIGFYRSIVNIDQPVTLATIFSGSSIGEKFWIDDIQAKQSRTENIQHKGETVEAFIEFIQPGFKLIIFGGGFDARPVSQLAKSLGWEVEVTDECVAHIAPVFFPTADKLALCDRKFIDRDFNITPYTACVLMSHNYEYDRDVLKKLVNTSTPYIGIMGPRKRFDKMLNEGVLLTEEQLNRVHSPIGLDIGAEAPDEIAIAIISEIQARFSKRDGGFLKNRTGAIHERDSNTDQVYKQVYLE